MSNAKKDPKVEEPKVEEPKVEEPKAEEPKVDAKKRVYVPKQGVTDTGRQFVSVNGRSFLVPKDEYHDLPEEIANEIIRGQKAEKRRDQEAAKRAQAGM